MNNQRLPTKMLLVKLVRDDREYIRNLLATSQRSLPDEVIEKLANDKELRVRESIAFNPQTDTRLLAKLADDKHQDVRRAVAHNKNYA